MLQNKNKPPHIHKFKRYTYKSGMQVFFCVLPDCNKKVNPSLVLGKKSICWRCGNEFIINEYSLRLAKPHCVECHKGKSKIKLEDVIKDVVNDIPISTNVTHLMNNNMNNYKFDESIEPMSLTDRLNQKLHDAQDEDEL